MCFLRASEENKDIVLQNAIDCGHEIISISPQPLTDGLYLITTIAPGASTW